MNIDNFNLILSNIKETKKYIELVDSNCKVATYHIILNNDQIKFEVMEYNSWNSISWFLPVEKNNLILFPSQMEHSVRLNEKATKDRISISFNIFVKGTLGEEEYKNQLILQ